MALNDKTMALLQRLKDDERGAVLDAEATYTASEDIDYFMGVADGIKHAFLLILESEGLF